MKILFFIVVAMTVFILSLPLVIPALIIRTSWEMALEIENELNKMAKKIKK